MPRYFARERRTRAVTLDIAPHGHRVTTSEDERVNEGKELYHTSYAQGQVSFDDSPVQIS